jgi:hypothetical protein
MSAGVNGLQSTLSRAFPKEVATFDLIDGVWVVEPRCTIPIVACPIFCTSVSVSVARR